MTDLRAGRKIGLTRRERLDRYANKTETCWLWTGPITAQGYGLAVSQGGRELAHRAAYEEWVGPINPVDLTVDHVCGIRPCVNPTHLRLLTRSDHGRIDERRRTVRSGGRGRGR